MSALDNLALSPSRRGLLTAGFAGSFLPSAFLSKPQTNRNSPDTTANQIRTQRFYPR